MQQSQIYSVSAEENPRPWVEFDVTDGSLDIELKKANGIAAFHRRSENQQTWRRDANASDQRMKNAVGKRRLRLSTKYPNEMHCLTINLDGDLVFHAVSEYEEAYYCNLAYYYPATGVWNRLVFVEDPNPGRFGL